MAIKSRESFEKTRDVNNNDKSKNTFYEDKEIQDIMKKYNQIKRNLTISSIFSKNLINTELKTSTYTNIFTSYSMIYHTLL